LEQPKREYGLVRKCDLRNDMEPNKLTDRYEATHNLYRLLREIIDSFEELEEESDEPIPKYCKRVKRVRDSLGPAQSSETPFSVSDYTEVHGDLPTLYTGVLSEQERAVLRGIGAIEQNEDPPLPTDSSGERLPLLLNSTNGIEEYIGVLEKYEQYISDESVKVLHVADTHIGFSRRDRDTSEKIEPTSAFREVGEIAIQEGVDAVVHAEDLFDDDVGKDNLEAFKDVIGRLRENDIEFCFILGNHGVRSLNYEGKAVAEVMEMQRRGEVTLLSREPVVLGDGVVALYGINHVGLGAEDWDFEREDWDYDGWDESWWDEPDLEFETATEAEHRVLCLHGDFRKGGADMPAERVMRESNMDLDALLLGHIHEYDEKDGVKSHDEAYYAGATQRFKGGDFDPRVKIFEFYDNGNRTEEDEKLSSSV
jgi:predicted MPP superfamily phosphohydrolase